MKFRCRYLLTAAALIAACLLLAACGGEEEEEAEAPADLTAGEITDEELSLMVVPLSELGSQYADFEFYEDESGFQSNEDIIDAAFDEEDEAGDVERFGRVNGYGEDYRSVEAALEREGAFLIGTATELYEDADGASGDLKDGVEDMQRQVGMTKEDVTLEDAEEFDPGRIADESAGLLLTGSVAAGQEVRYYMTVVGFRRGRLLGSVAIARFDEEDVREEAEALARKLDERITAVLRGEVEPRPTPTLFWRFETGGRVRSSPAVADEAAYVGSNDTCVYALDTATGEERWRFKTGGFIVSSAAVVDGVVYVGSNDSYVYALDAATGEERWRFETGYIVHSPPRSWMG